MSETIRGIGVSLSIGMDDEALAASVTSVTRAAPPVCTALAHGMSSGAIGYWSSVAGMHELGGQACLVHVVNADSFTLPGLDAAGWRAFVSGQFRRVTQWAVLSESVGYSLRQQQPASVRAVRAFDRNERWLWGLGGNQIINVEVRSQSAVNTVRALLESAATRRAALTFRVALADGRVRVWRGVPSPVGESLASGRLGVGSFQVLVSGEVVISREQPAVAPPPIPGASAPPPPGGGGQTFYLTDEFGNRLTDEAANPLTWN